MCADYINNSLAEDKCDNVSVPGLYTAACYHNKSARTSEWHKMRWAGASIPCRWTKWGANSHD